jgi:hypothetical protein
MAYHGATTSPSPWPLSSSPPLLLHCPSLVLLNCPCLAWSRASASDLLPRRNKCSLCGILPPIDSQVHPCVSPTASHGHTSAAFTTPLDFALLLLCLGYMVKYDHMFSFVSFFQKKIQPCNDAMQHHLFTTHLPTFFLHSINATNCTLKVIVVFSELVVTWSKEYIC